jgi:hypothetical protein
MMCFMERVLLIWAPAGRLVTSLVLACAMCSLSSMGCASKVQQTSHYAGEGMREGTPPMCFQYRIEMRPTARAGNLWLHANNTCSFVVDCVFYDDVTEQNFRLVQAGYQSRSVVLAAEVPASDADVDVKCTWQE